MSDLYCTWTHRTELPASLKSQFGDLDFFVSDIIAKARARLLIVAPYLSVPGLTRLKGPLAAAASNGAWIRVVTSAVTDRVSWNSKAVRALVADHDGEIIRKRLRLLCGHETSDIFIHAKVVVADGLRGYLGSANVSEAGFDKNFEVGVSLSLDQATTFERLIDDFEVRGLIVDCTEANLGL